MGVKIETIGVRQDKRYKEPHPYVYKETKVYKTGKKSKAYTEAVDAAYKKLKETKKNGKEVGFEKGKWSRLVGGGKKMKKVMKPTSMTVKISEYESAPYIPIYMKQKIKEDKRQFFFK